MLLKAEFGSTSPLIQRQKSWTLNFKNVSADGRWACEPDHQKSLPTPGEVKGEAPLALQTGASGSR